jgi:hypothetical protein
MLEPAAASITQIAASEQEFWDRCDDDSDGWLLRPLVEQCYAAGMHLTERDCYAFTVLPFLGGQYNIENIWICPWQEWFSYTGSLYLQTKDLPDGTKITIRITD